MKILLIIWADPCWHPTFVSTAQVFAEAGHQVRILGCEPPPDFALPGPVDFGSGVRVERRPQGRGGLRNRLDFLRFCRRAFGLSRAFKPDVVIGFDILGVVAALAATGGHRSARLIYHNYDLVSPQGLSPFMRVLKRLEHRAIRRAGRVLVSSPGRAEVLQAEAHLSRTPDVVMNCQRLNAPLQETGALRRLLREQDVDFERIVVRMGMITRGNAVEALIRSVAHWQGNWGLIIAGVAYPDFLQEMRALVFSLGLQTQVIFLPSVSSSLWYDCLKTADLGIALYIPENVNNQNMAGAGNKLNMYLSAKIPSIVPDLPDFARFIEKFRAGVLADATDPQAIARAVNEVLSDPQKCAFYSENARRAFESEYNFEAQYAPVLDYVNEIALKRN